MERRSDGTVSQELVAIQVQTGEPDPSLFFVPEDYAELPRHEHYRRAMEARGKQPNPSTYEIFKRADQMREKLCKEGKAGSGCND